MLIGIGVGPGDPELLTLKAARMIRELPVLAYIGADGRQSRARRIAAGVMAPGAVELSADLPMRTSLDAARPIYDDLAMRIRAHVRSGCSVGFLCEGDPLLFGSFVAIMERLSPELPVSIIPGITSLAASAARLKHVLALGQDVLTVLPATADDERLRAALGNADSVAVLKVGRHLPRVRHLLESAGLAGDAQVITDIGGAEEAVQPLQEIEADRLPYFALILARRPRAVR